jgi:hypothetical protein
MITLNKAQRVIVDGALLDVGEHDRVQIIAGGAA